MIYDIEVKNHTSKNISDQDIKNLCNKVEIIKQMVGTDPFDIDYTHHRI
jgi:hypothetical protein